MSERRLQLVGRSAVMVVVALALVTVAGGGLDVPKPAAASPPVAGAVSLAAQPSVVPPVLDPSELRTVAEVYELFAAADLSLRHAHAAFHDDPVHCGGHQGRHRVFANGSVAIDVCMAHDIDEIEQIGRRRILVHELAHAHLEHQLTDDQRTAFMELRGLTEWSSGPWEGRGAEHAAEVLLWALTDFEVHVRIGGEGCEELVVAVELLVGSSIRAC